jgi:exodeoxyribonuclease III
MEATPFVLGRGASRVARVGRSADLAGVRIATWNVNSLPARLEKVWWWLDRAKPDVLLMQETKLADSAAPYEEFKERGYELVHHGQGRWNGVAIASRAPLSDVVKAFGGTLAEAPSSEVEDPFAEARMIAATTLGLRVVSVYVPNGRVVDSPFYVAKLAWLARLERWLREAADPRSPLVIGGDFNIAPVDADVWDATACHGATHVSPREREALQRIQELGLIDAYRLKHDEPGRYSWWDYRAGAFHKNWGMRIDLLLTSESVAKRIVWAEIDREARKGKPIPSDHAPVVVDLDEPGQPFDAQWTRADAKVTLPRK